MNPLIFNELSESIRLCERLLTAMESEKREFAMCVKGEVLRSYEKSTDKFLEKTRELRDILKQMQNEQLMS